MTKHFCPECGAPFADEYKLGEHFIDSHGLSSLVIKEPVMDDYHKLDPDVKYIFCYGTLRPDIGTWKKQLGNPKYVEACVPNSGLFYDKSIKYLVGVMKPPVKSEIVGGFLMYDKDLVALLKKVDHIEVCPRLYQRIIVEAYDLTHKKMVKAYFYTRKYDRQNMTPISFKEYIGTLI